MHHHLIVKRRPLISTLANLLDLFKLELFLSPSFYLLNSLLGVKFETKSVDLSFFKVFKPL
jgi:hypothetical protein